LWAGRDGYPIRNACVVKLAEGGVLAGAAGSPVP
jgi:hypothetical protein